MQHLHDDALTLLAMGQTPSMEEHSHLENCPRCRADLGSFRRVVSAARRAGGTQTAGTRVPAPKRQELRVPHDAAHPAPDPAPKHHDRRVPNDAALPAPDPAVWAAIHRELDLDEDLREDPLSAPNSTLSPAISGPPAAPDDSVPLASVAPLSTARRRRRPRGVWLAVAAGGIVVAAAGTWGALRAADTVPGPEVIASVDLTPLPSYSDTGSAVVDQLPDGRRELVVSASSNAAQGFREVWLLAPDATSMVSLGTMEGTEGHFELPADLDLSQYPVVDISDEPFDGNPAHSGDSILRGQLLL